MGRQDFPGILDRSKVVALDFGSPEFRQHAHRLVAGWARQPPFYVLGDGPPQVIVGRYADVHEVFSDAERFASQTTAMIVPRPRRRCAAPPKSQT